MELREIQEKLREDLVFFENYKDKFISNFVEALVSENPSMKDTPVLNTMVGRIYTLLFSLSGDPKRDLFALSSTLARNRLAFKKILLDTCLKMMKDYIDHIAKNLSDYNRIKSFIDLIDIYIGVVEDAYIDYVKSLKEDIAKEKDLRRAESEHLAIDLLNKLLRKGIKKVVVHARYKGLFVDTRSELMSLRDTLLKIKTSHMSVYHEGLVLYLKGAGIPEAIEAEVVSVDTDGMTIDVEVKGFINLPDEKRKHVRVVPERDIMAKIAGTSEEIEGIVSDVSVHGVGVYVRDVGGIKVGDEVNVSFDLPKGSVSVSGEVKHITPFNNVKKVGVFFNADLQTEDLISDFVVGRQMDLIREIKD